MKNIEEFIVKVSEKDIDLLNKKIDLTRWPDEINHRWSHGTDLNFLKELGAKNIIFSGNIKLLSEVNVKNISNLNENILLKKKFW